MPTDYPLPDYHMLKVIIKLTILKRIKISGSIFGANRIRLKPGMALDGRFLAGFFRKNLFEYEFLQSVGAFINM